jgi:hypothetical protein
LGDIIELGGQVRALRWVDGASGALTGSLEGLYEAFRGDDEDGKDSAVVLVLRMLLAQAVALDVEAAQLQNELDDVI